MTPCSQKLSAVKKKHFAKYAPATCDVLIVNGLTSYRGGKPVQLFAPKEEPLQGAGDMDVDENDENTPHTPLDVDKENPF
jgi:hypothetical protein